MEQIKELLDNGWQLTIFKDADGYRVVILNRGMKRPMQHIVVDDSTLEGVLQRVCDLAKEM